MQFQSPSQTFSWCLEPNNYHLVIFAHYLLFDTYHRSCNTFKFKLRSLSVALFSQAQESQVIGCPGLVGWQNQCRKQVSNQKKRKSLVCARPSSDSALVQFDLRFTCLFVFLCTSMSSICSSAYLIYLVHLAYLIYLVYLAYLV